MNAGLRVRVLNIYFSVEERISLGLLFNLVREVNEYTHFWIISRSKCN
jgi:hypothetical protein